MPALVGGSIGVLGGWVGSVGYVGGPPLPPHYRVVPPIIDYG